MADAIAHRGPDSHGIWLEGQAGLAHRRLAIVDLTPSGAQPMISDDGRYVVTFNGEIYNYQEIRERLVASGKQLRSTSDTEILLVLYAMEGERMLSHLRGMFALAIWDKEKRELFFARDRIGKKPFFYRHDENGFAFASELKSLHVLRKPEIDPESIKLFLGLQYVPSPLTGFKNLFSLEPGMCGMWKDGKLTTHSYLETAPIEKPSFSDAAAHVRELLEESVRLRLIADVPVGIFLSGGIDSSAVAAIAHAQGAKLSSFTLGFDEAAFDERDQASALAKKLGFEHHAFLAKPEDMLAIADEVIAHYDAPYADSSSLNTWILARETKKHAKAVLTGDGGDELFGGYRRYQHYASALRLKRFGLGGLAHIAAQILHRHTGDPRYARFAATIEGGYAALFCGAYFQQPEAIAFVNQRLKSRIDPVAAAMDFDLRSYLPDDLNVKMDRASMAHGLEARSPFLDQELVSYVTQLPSDYRFKRGKLKPLLVEAVKDLLPDDIARRPKRGFQVPLAVWFRGSLRAAFVDRCLESTKVHAYIDKSRIEQLLQENDRGSDHGNRLWMMYSLATWLQTYG
jgi:asparagine synthase (glutamine-hydrolysing)